MPARKFGATVVALAIVAVLPAAPAGAAAVPDGRTAGNTVTLISGDRVTLVDQGGKQVPQIEPGLGREHVAFTVDQRAGHTFVLPGDAVALVGSGKLDRRLFDVSGLLAQGYGDASRRTVPLIVRGGQGASRSMGAMATMDLPGIRAQVLDQPKDRLTEFWGRIAGGVSAFGAGVERIWLDGKVSVSLKESVPQIGAPKAWQAGYTGQGVKVAVLDTGVDTDHPDLRGRVAAERNFSDSPEVRDRVGHGTHVASTVGGAGGYRGVAPDSVLLSGKVLNDEGAGMESQIIAGMEWAVAEGARVVNMSLGGLDTPDLDPSELAVNELSAKHNVLFVIAAGNAGPEAKTVGSPGSADAALTVGAVDKADQIADFSSRGPTLAGTIKPDVTAPGVGIVAARAAGTSAGKPVDADHTALNGTSMATPHVAGAAALLAQQHPEWSGQQLKAALMSSARPNPALEVNEQGAGRVDVGVATSLSAYALPSSISAGRAEWPHGDDKPSTTPITYHNPGHAPVTLNLAVEAKRADGTPAPTGLFTVDKESVEVAAGGSAVVNFTVNTAVPGPDGVFSGQLVASGKDTSVVTPVIVDKEAESYTLTVKHLGRDGKPAASFYGEAGADFKLPPGADGVATLRVPKGRHSLYSVIYTEGADASVTVVAQPVLDVNGDTTVVLDARQAKPVRVDLDSGQHKASLRMAAISVTWPREQRWMPMFTRDLNQVYTLQVGAPVSEDELVTQIAGSWEVPDANGGFANSTIGYTLSWFEPGRLFDGLVRRVGHTDLAEVRSELRSPRGHEALQTWVADYHGKDVGSGPNYRVGASRPSRVDYHNVESGMEWRSELENVNVDTDSFVSEQKTGPLRHRAGQRYVQTWNAAVIGPALPAAARLERTGDMLDLAIPMYSDAPDRFGRSPIATGTTTLYREGKKIAETAKPGSGRLTMPAENGRYRLEATAAHQSTELSSTVSAKWTFDSAHVPGTKPLPLQAIRFAPEGLDADNGVVAGCVTTVPITVQRYGGAGELDRLTMELSFDDGATWATVPVNSRGDQRSVSIAHPGKPGFVSLRATASDRQGNSVEQTILRAYALK